MPETTVIICAVQFPAWADMGDFSIQQFEADGQENGIRFWYAHQFMKALGYDSWPTFQKVITKAMGSCARLGIDPTEAFSLTTIIENDKEIKTYKLSRFACLLVSMHADSKKEEVAEAKAALAALADQLIEEKIHEHDLGRIETREDLKFAEKVLSGTAQDAGLGEEPLRYLQRCGFSWHVQLESQRLDVEKGC